MVTPDEREHLLTAWRVANVWLAIPVVAVNVLAVAVWLNGDATWGMNALQAAVTLPLWASVVLHRRADRRERWYD